MTIQRGGEEAVLNNNDNVTTTNGNFHERDLSGDSTHRCGLAGGSVHNRGLPGLSQQGKAVDCTTIRRTIETGGNKHGLRGGGSGHYEGVHKKLHDRDGVAKAGLSGQQSQAGPFSRATGRGLKGGIPGRNKSNDGIISVLPRRTLSDNRESCGSDKSSPRLTQGFVSIEAKAVGAPGDRKATSNEPGLITDVGGASQGKIRKATNTATVSKPGVVSVLEGTAASSKSIGTSGVGGAPEGKIRKVATVSKPGAVSVVEPALPARSESCGTAGVGGAPEGKMRKAATVAKPGAVSVLEPTLPARSESGGTACVGGAPQGKIRKATNSAALSKPGAVCVVEPTSIAISESDGSTCVGGVPQGKIRRSTNTAAISKPGAVSVVTSLLPAKNEAGVTTCVGEVPQGKIRRTTNTVSRPGAMSVIEPSHAAVSEPHVSTVVGGAPQGKIRRATYTVAITKPGAMSVVEPSAATVREPGRCTGVGGTETPPATSFSSGAVSIAIPSQSTLKHDSTVALVGSALQKKTRYSTKSTQKPCAPIAGTQDVLGDIEEPRIVTPAVATTQSIKHGSAVDEAGASNKVLLKRGLGSSGMSNSHVPSTSQVLSNKTFQSGRANKNMLGASHSLFTGDIQGIEIPVGDADFDAAIQLVDEEIQAKMNARSQDPSARPGVFFTETEKAGLNPAEDSCDLEVEKESEIFIFKSPATTRTSQERMELKILQMEQEQQSRDEKLESLEEATLQCRRQGTSKVGPSQRSGLPEVFDDESSEIENQYLHPDPAAVRQAEEDGLAIAVAVEESDEPDVYDVEVKVYDPEAKPPFFKNRRFRCYAALIFCLVLGAIVTTVTVSALKSGEVILITEAPSAAPSQAPTTIRETAVQGELARVIGDKVNEPNTVYAKARDWILYEDPMELNEFSENLIQRYTLAFFYFQTSQQGNWTSCNPPVEGEDYTCEYIDSVRQEDNSWVPVPREEPEVRWLSERHECEWAEIQCHPEKDGDVVVIDINHQNLSGTLPEELKYLERLLWLTLSFNYFTGTIPAAYGEFDYLAIFEVTENLLTGQIPSGFFRQPNLLQFNPTYNQITGTIPPEIGDLTTLHSVFWYGTDIGGTLPTELGRLEGLRNLWFYDNAFFSGGPVPSEIGKLSLLEQLILANNGHTGSLPSELGLLSNFNSFLFSGNNLEGSTIPEEFWNATSLEQLDIDNAGFGGTLSKNIGKMTNLIGIKASRNQFTGTVPTEIGLIGDNLLLLWFHFNDLTGSIPLDICRLRGPNNLQFINADCGGSDAQISCISGCCTGCCDEFGQCQQL